MSLPVIMVFRLVFSFCTFKRSTSAVCRYVVCVDFLFYSGVWQYGLYWQKVAGVEMAIKTKQNGVANKYISSKRYRNQNPKFIPSHFLLYFELKSFSVSSAQLSYYSVICEGIGNLLATGGSGIER